MVSLNFVVSLKSLPIINLKLSGDSGSAIVRDGVQVGLVAFGSSVCGDGSRPAVYTRIEEPVVRSFIFEHTGV